MNDLTALEKQTIERAVAGDQKALEEVLAGVQDLVFNLSLRTRRTPPRRSSSR